MRTIKIETSSTIEYMIDSAFPKPHEHVQELSFTVPEHSSHAKYKLSLQELQNRSRHSATRAVMRASVRSVKEFADAIYCVVFYFIKQNIISLLRLRRLGAPPLGAQHSELRSERRSPECFAPNPVDRSAELIFCMLFMVIARSALGGLGRSPNRRRRKQ